MLGSTLPGLRHSFGGSLRKCSGLALVAIIPGQISIEGCGLAGGGPRGFAVRSARGSACDRWGSRRFRGCWNCDNGEYEHEHITLSADSSLQTFTMSVLIVFLSQRDMRRVSAFSQKRTSTSGQPNVRLAP